MFRTKIPLSIYGLFSKGFRKYFFTATSLAFIGLLFCKRAVILYNL